MKNYALNLEKRMKKTFEEHNRMYAEVPTQAYFMNIDVCEIAVQELQKEYERYKRNRKLKDEILYYKECYPIIGKWKIYFCYILSLEETVFIADDEIKLNTFKKCMHKLNSDFKKNYSASHFYYETTTATTILFTPMVA